MKRHLMFIMMAVVLSMLPGTAMADSIKGKLGVSGRLGFMIPSDSEFSTTYTIMPGLAITATEKETADPAFVGGGGFIFGVTDNLAVLVDVTHAPSIVYEFHGVSKLKITTTAVSLGGQYRFFPEYKLVPYVGAGMDILFGDGKYVETYDLDIDTVVGGDVNAGVDFFITKQIALNADFRGVWFPEADLTLKSSGLKAGEYDPSSFIGLFGVRYFFN